MECNTEAVKVEELDGEQVRNLYDLLREIPDGRHARGRRYEAAAVVLLLLLGKLAGKRRLGLAGAFEQKVTV